MDLEARYDGPIPAHERRAIAFGSKLAADIAEISAEAAFFRAMVERTRSSGKAWLHSGNRELAAHARADARVYLTAWRNRRSRLARLLHDAGLPEARISRDPTNSCRDYVADINAAR